MDTIASRCTPTQPSHVGLRAGFVYEDQAGRIKPELESAPTLAFPGYVRSILFAGPKRLFLYVSPMSSST